MLEWILSQLFYWNDINFLDGSSIQLLSCLKAVLVKFDKKKEKNLTK